MENILSNLIIENVRAVTTMYNDSGSGNSRRGRENWGFIFKYEGETVYRHGSKKIVSNANRAVILPKGSSYDWECTAAGHYACIEFEAEAVLDEIITFPVSNGDEILRLFRQLEYKRLRQKTLYNIESIRDVYSIILKLVSTQSTEYVPSKKSERLSPALDYMIVSYTEQMTNDALADLCGMSTVYFRKLFKDTYGVSPIEYARGLRIKKAKEMLKGDFGSISDIAVSLGYSSIYDFSRDFKKHTGVAPSKY